MVVCVLFSVTICRRNTLGGKGMKRLGFLKWNRRVRLPNTVNTYHRGEGSELVMGEEERWEEVRIRRPWAGEETERRNCSKRRADAEPLNGGCMRYTKNIFKIYFWVYCIRLP